MALVARDLMQRHVICVSPEDPLSSVQRLFSEEEIHGAPVVDDQEKLVGVISSTDLLRAAADGRDCPALGEALLPRFSDFSEPPRWQNLPEGVGQHLGAQVVSDVMSPDVVCVDEGAPVPQVALALRENRVHRVMVLTGGKVAGVISTFDLLALLEKD